MRYLLASFPDSAGRWGFAPGTACSAAPKRQEPSSTCRTVLPYLQLGFDMARISPAWSKIEEAAVPTEVAIAAMHERTTTR
jgi:hypothetical protein